MIPPVRAIGGRWDTGEGTAAKTTRIDDPGGYAGHVIRYNAVRAASGPRIADDNPPCRGVTEAPDA
ncbi:hypothetical protein ACF1BB_18090 [Streptomyces griseoluteus]|uniref:hypothetical protein n=1 Tax=Streptomyces griseoluteus TaxID=29306 RepID=UPI0036FF9D3D